MSNNLGQRIRLMREELDMSQLDLAKKLNIGKPSSGKVNTKAYHNLEFDGLSDEDIEKVEDYAEFIKSKYNPDGTLKEDKKDSKK